MKYFFIAAFLIFNFNTSLFAIANQTPGPDGVRFSFIDIKMAEENLKRELENKNLNNKKKDELINLQKILTAGKRSILWFEKINSTRPPEKKLDLSSKETSQGIPLTNPLKTNSNILITRFDQLMNQFDPLVINVIAGTDELPETAPIPDESFVKMIRSFDVVYQHTIRWTLAQESLSWYINKSIWDIRGYLFLKATPDLEKKLSTWSSLTEDQKINFKIWLLALCHNGDFEVKECKEVLEKAISRGNTLNFYKRLISDAEEMYQSFYQVSLTRIRPEIYWNQERTILHSPFLTPYRLDVKKWLIDNIQKEWQGLGFNLQLDFLDSSEKIIPHIEFKSGVTAHVDKIGGDTITIDADHSINNYSQRWSIRHEYGHVLGFPDCYLEFYDTNEGAMIYYEIDINNIMCSRHGTFQKEHLFKLQTIYQ